jgi:hypothetical protein
MMTQRKLFLSIIPFVLISGYFFIQYAKNPLTYGFGIYPTLNETEKALVIIINQSLERALIDGEIIDGSFPNQSQPVVLSTRNIDQYWVFPVDGWDVEVLTIDEIREALAHVDINGRLSRGWLQFNEITFQTDELVYVEMGLMDDYVGNEWGISYWGLKIYFEKTSEEGWIINSSSVMVI